MKNWLKILRKSFHMTQMDVAEASHISRKTYIAVENGLVVPSAKTAKAIAETLHFSPTWYRVLDLRETLAGK